jgi:hypothetical protein
MNKKILIAALCVVAATAVVPPIKFVRSCGLWQNEGLPPLHYVEYRFLWDMEPRGPGYLENYPVRDDYAGIDFPRFGIQLFGIAALGFAVSLAYRPQHNNPVRNA